ncbi:hypothetical protein Syun_015075 [Stephania yunnanensis]|uniref:Uncharacterized protein n=1 Tax=Stephania yunnanensis TaxID=152371 RepID=A0AAP0PCI1_9MAGN
MERRSTRANYELSHESFEGHISCRESSQNCIHVFLIRSVYWLYVHVESNALFGLNLRSPTV